MLAETVLHTIEKYNLIEKGDNVIVGISGGPDSVCLLHIMHRLAERIGIKLYAVHVNHGLRGSESDEDEAFVRDFCSRLGVELKVHAADIAEIAKEKGISLEEAGREIRYREFHCFGEALGGAKIAVAHNKNDQAETLLMRLIRGTGLDGLKGMNHKRETVIRPLLDIPREDIESYCRENALAPRTDSSNLQSIYTRNKIRLGLIPYINQSFSTDIVETLYRTSLVLRDDYEAMEAAVRDAYRQCLMRCNESCVELDNGCLDTLHPGIAKRVVRSAIRKVKGDLKGIENKHIEDILDLIREGRTGAILQLPQGIRIARSYGIIKVHRDPGKGRVQHFDHLLHTPGITSVEEIGGCIQSEIIERNENSNRHLSQSGSSRQQFFDYEKLLEGINKGIKIRNRRDGDIFKPFRSSGTKKLKEYFIDNKIPRDSRDKIPLIAKNNEIVWVVGYKTSDNFKVTENTKRVLMLEYHPKSYS